VYHDTIKIIIRYRMIALPDWETLSSERRRESRRLNKADGRGGARRRGPEIEDSAKKKRSR